MIHFRRRSQNIFGYEVSLPCPTSYRFDFPPTTYMSSLSKY